MENEFIKAKIQEKQYEFPYHYIHYFDDKGRMVRFRATGVSRYQCCLLHNKEIIESSNVDSVLDVGCGDGRLLGILNENIKHKVGVDLSEKAISFARAFHPDINFQAKDAKDVEGEFDIVVSMQVLEHISDDKVNDFLRTVAIRTKLGGQVIISVPTTVLSLDKKHYRHYDIDLFARQLESSNVNLRIEKVQYIHRTPFWLKIYRRGTNNKVWFFGFKALDNYIWNYCWRNLRITDEKHGEDMVIILKKQK